MNMNLYKSFLKICGCDADEYQCKCLKKACNRWGISEKEIEAAYKFNIPNFYKIQYEGVRKLLGLYVQEWIHLESLWQKDCFKIYYNVPGSVSGMVWLKESCKTDVYVGSPDLISMVVLYGIIGIKEKIENNSCRHCAVNMMRFKQSEQSLIPPPDIRWSNGLLCDEAPKLDAVLSEKDVKTRHIFILKAGKYDISSLYMEEQIKEVFEEIANNYPFLLEEQTFKTVKKSRFLLALKIEQIIQLLNKKKKFLLGNAELTLLETMLLTNFDVGMDEMINVVSDLYKEIKNVKTIESIPEMKQRYSIYYTPVCNPEYSKIFEDNKIGLLVQVAFKSKGILYENESWQKEIAMECLGMTIGLPATVEAEEISNVIRQYQLDGLVLGMFSFDRWLGAHQNLLKSIVEEKTGKNVFVYETDFWNQESFTQDRMKTAVETLKIRNEWDDLF